MNRSSCWQRAGKAQEYPPRLLWQVLPHKFSAKIMLHGQTRSGTRSVPKAQLILTCDLPLTNIRGTKELTASGKTGHREPLAQDSWCFQGLMAQISTTEHLQDLLMGTKSKYHHLSERMVGKDVPDLNTAFQCGQRGLLLGTRWAAVKWRHSGFCKCHYNLFLHYSHDLGDTPPSMESEAQNNSASLWATGKWGKETINQPT